MTATHYRHKIRLDGRTSKYSVYFRADPICGIASSLTTIADAERIDRLGRSYPCTDKEIDELLKYRHTSIAY